MREGIQRKEEEEEALPLKKGKKKRKRDLRTNPEWDRQNVFSSVYTNLS